MKRLVFKNYVIKNLIAKGGMADIFLAWDTDYHREVALKFLVKNPDGNTTHRQRFLREIEILAHLNHENIVQFYDGGEVQNQIYMALEYIDGLNLYRIIQNYKKLPIPIALHISNEILKGLQYIHDQGVIHRDLKPSNIFINRKDGRIMLGDFGIIKANDSALLTQENEIVGTPAYMSPEQVMHSPITHKADFFSLGVTLYEMFSGKNPFHDPNMNIVLMRIVGSIHQPLIEVEPAIPEAIDDLVENLLAVSPKERPNSVQEILGVVQKETENYPMMTTGKFFEKFCTSPDTYKMKTNEILSQNIYRKALYSLDEKPPQLGKSLLELRKAANLYSDNRNAVNLLKKLCQENNVKLKTERDEELYQLEKKIHTEGSNPEYLKELIDVHLSKGNFFRAYELTRRLKRLNPVKEYAEELLEKLMCYDLGLPIKVHDMTENYSMSTEKTETSSISTVEDTPIKMNAIDKEIPALRLFWDAERSFDAQDYLSALEHYQKFTDAYLRSLVYCLALYKSALIFYKIGEDVKAMEILEKIRFSDGNRIISDMVQELKVKIVQASGIDLREAVPDSGSSVH